MAKTRPWGVGLVEYWSIALITPSLGYSNLRKYFLTSFLSLMLFSLVDVQFAAAKTVTFAYNTPTLSGTLPIMVAQDFGFFAGEGLEVKTVFIRGGPTAMAALIGGGVDYTFVAGVAAVRAIAQNAPMLVISGMQPYMDYTLIGGKGITVLNDLKGKIVGVTGPGGVAEFASVEGLAKKGLVRDRDYKILYGVGNSPRPSVGIRQDSGLTLFFFGEVGT